MPSLFDPIQLGDLYLPNRILMAASETLKKLASTTGSLPYC